MRFPGHNKSTWTIQATETPVLVRSKLTFHETSEHRGLKSLDALCKGGAMNFNPSLGFPHDDAASSVAHFITMSRSFGSGLRLSEATLHLITRTCNPQIPPGQTAEDSNLLHS